MHKHKFEVADKWKPAMCESAHPSADPLQDLNTNHSRCFNPPCSLFSLIHFSARSIQADVFELERYTIICSLSSDISPQPKVAAASNLRLVYSVSFPSSRSCLSLLPPVRTWCNFITRPQWGPTPSQRQRWQFSLWQLTTQKPFVPRRNWGRSPDPDDDGN